MGLDSRIGRYQQNQWVEQIKKKKEEEAKKSENSEQTQQEQQTNQPEFVEQEKAVFDEMDYFAAMNMPLIHHDDVKQQPQDELPIMDDVPTMEEDSLIAPSNLDHYDGQNGYMSETEAIWNEGYEPSTDEFNEYNDEDNQNHIHPEPYNVGEPQIMEEAMPEPLSDEQMPIYANDLETQEISNTPQMVSGDNYMDYLAEMNMQSVHYQGYQEVVNQYPQEEPPIMDIPTMAEEGVVNVDDIPTDDYYNPPEETYRFDDADISAHIGEEDNMNAQMDVPSQVQSSSVETDDNHDVELSARISDWEDSSLLEAANISEQIEADMRELQSYKNDEYARHTGEATEKLQGYDTNATISYNYDDSGITEFMFECGNKTAKFIIENTGAGRIIKWIADGFEEYPMNDSVLNSMLDKTTINDKTKQMINFALDLTSLIPATSPIGAVNSTISIAKTLFNKFYQWWSNDDNAQNSDIQIAKTNNKIDEVPSPHRFAAMMEADFNSPNDSEYNNVLNEEPDTIHSDAHLKDTETLAAMGINFDELIEPEEAILADN